MTNYLATELNTRALFMISNDYFRKDRCYCTTPELIENYEKAIADTENTWICHHKLESCFTRNFLKKMGLYYNQPPEALVFCKNTKEHYKYKHKAAGGEKRTFIKCIETGEVHYTREWKRLGFRHIDEVARGTRKTCNGFHFIEVK